MTKYKVGEKVVLKGTYGWKAKPEDVEYKLSPIQKFKYWIREYDLNLKKGSIVKITDYRTDNGFDEYWIEDVEDGAFTNDDFEPYKDRLAILNEKLSDGVKK